MLQVATHIAREKQQKWKGTPHMRTPIDPITPSHDTHGHSKHTPQSTTQHWVNHDRLHAHSCSLSLFRHHQWILLYSSCFLLLQHVVVFLVASTWWMNLYYISPSCGTRVLMHQYQMHLYIHKYKYIHLYTYAHAHSICTCIYSPISCSHTCTYLSINGVAQRSSTTKSASLPGRKFPIRWSRESAPVVHTHTHTHTIAHTNTHTHTHMLTQTHTHIHIYASLAGRKFRITWLGEGDAGVYTHTHTNPYTHLYTSLAGKKIEMRWSREALVYTYPRTNTHTHTHRHLCIFAYTHLFGTHTWVLGENHVF